MCHFANWSVLPAEVAAVMFMGYDIPEAFIHRNSKVTDRCVISGKDPVTVNEKIETAIKMHPHLDMKDLRAKMEKDVGVWITYVEEDDNINNIDFPIGWSAGNTALYLACQSGAEEVYILGFDLSSYDEPLNNIYKGTDNYLSLYICCSTAHHMMIGQTPVYKLLLHQTDKPDIVQYFQQTTQ